MTNYAVYSPSAIIMSHQSPKALVFDLMGTCTNWSASIVAALKDITPKPLPYPLNSNAGLKSFAGDWRARFFQEIHQRFERGELQEDIDVTHRRVLDQLCLREGVEWDELVKEQLIQSWHTQEAWPDAIEGLQRLSQKFFVIVLANGTTRLQLDIIKSSGLRFHTLFSSQLLGLTKPDLNIYKKALELISIKPEESIMVAAHAYDLRAASKVGMQTAYIYRTTEDLDENMDQVHQESGMFISGTDGSRKCGINALADLLGA